MASRRPTAVTNVEEAAIFGGFSAIQGEEEKTRKDGNCRYEIGPDTVKPISFELGGRQGPQTINVLQELTTKLAEARGGELIAAAVVDLGKKEP